MNKKMLQRWDKLLDFYCKDSCMTEEWRERVDWLLAQQLFEEEKNAALEKYFNKTVGFDAQPNDAVKMRLHKIKAELNFPETGSPEYQCLP